MCDSHSSPRHSLDSWASLFRLRILFALVLLLASPHGFAHAQTAAESCTLQKGSYVCNWQTFRARFAAVHTVSIEAQPLDRASERRLRELVEALGKRIATPDQPADMIFRVLPASSTGIVYGPADQPLATLQVLAPGSDGRPGPLLWAETFVGQADRPWPLVVTAVANQFRARFSPSGR